MRRHPSIRGLRGAEVPVFVSAPNDCDRHRVCEGLYFLSGFSHDTQPFMIMQLINKVGAAQVVTTSPVSFFISSLLSTHEAQTAELWGTEAVVSASHRGVCTQSCFQTCADVRMTFSGGAGCENKCPTFSRVSPASQPTGENIRIMSKSELTLFAMCTHTRSLTPVWLLSECLHR